MSDAPPHPKPGFTPVVFPVPVPLRDIVEPPAVIGTVFSTGLEVRDGYWPLRAGDVFDFGSRGRFTLKKSLGRGGVGEVFLAEAGIPGRSQLREVYALKVLRPDARPPRGRTFIDEAERLCAFRHSAVGLYFSYFMDHRRQVVVMDYVEGRTLREVMELARRKGQKLSVLIVLELVAQVAETLYWVHRAKNEKGQPLNIVHRDISPSNILVSKLGFTSLVDFGLASDEPEDQERMGAAFVERKEPYQSPEQARHKKIDGRSDLFSLGCVMLEMLTGAPPFGRRGHGTLRSAAQVTPEYVDRLTRGLSKDVRVICRKALARDPAQRFEDGVEMSRAIRMRHPLHGRARCVEDELKRLDALPDMAPLSRDQVPEPEPVLEPERKRRTLVALAIALALALVGAGVAAWSALRATQPATPPPLAAPR